MRQLGTVAEAYRISEGITRTQAKNFYYGIRLLPTQKRLALCALYAMARRIDDIGDGDMPVEDKCSALASTRESLEHADVSVDPVLTALADAARRYPVPLPAFGELIDGVRMDVDGTTYEDFSQLVVYCRRVAGSIGRLCLSVFGPVNRETALYADQLGIALQQTNILRDVREDLLNGRIYLPRDELDRSGVRLAVDDRGVLDDPNGALAALVRACADRAEDWYSLGLRLIPHLDRRSGACCLAMAGIYRQLLACIKSSPVIIYDRRLSLSGTAKVRVAATAIARAAV
ncbi:presqualene diphosphate synthase HpnD [Mycobacterium sp. ML4]